MHQTGRPPRGGRARAPLAALILAVTGLVVGLVVGLGWPPVAAQAQPPRAATVPVPVLGSTTVNVDRSAASKVTVLVNGVRRVPGGTVLYYSMGAPAGLSVSQDRLSNVNPQARYNGPGRRTGTQFVIDGAANLVFEPLINAQLQTLSSPLSAWPQTGGTFYVLYQVMPELPASATKVDVMVGHGDIVPGVPVEDGAMLPAVSGDQPIALGTGWPAIDLAAVRSSIEPQRSIRPLGTESSDDNKTVVTREQPEQVTVDLSSDVLFAVDSAQLSPAAKVRLARAAAKVNSSAAPGVVKVLGYTDDTGTAEHNLELSKNRAASVAAALKGLVTASGVTFQEQGLGESDPVTSNSTPAGRRENRRVSLVFAPKGQS